MRRSAVYTLLVALIVSSCNTNEKEARARLERARTLFVNNDWFAAKNEIDSIRVYYPKEFKVLKEGLELMRQIEMKESERTIAYCDSMIPVKMEEFDVLKKDFLLDKDTVYQDIGNYVWKQQTIERNVQRCYIRCGVDEKGEIYIASVYFGSAPINHTGIKLSIPGGEFAETPSIPFDGGNNYRFEDLGNTTEVVTYKAEKGMDAIKFIDTYANERIRVEYTGGKPYVIYMADADKKAIVATYDLSVVLSDIETMKTEREKALKKQAYLKSKLEKE